MVFSLFFFDFFLYQYSRIIDKFVREISYRIGIIKNKQFLIEQYFNFTTLVFVLIFINIILIILVVKC